MEKIQEILSSVETGGVFSISPSAMEISPAVFNAIVTPWIQNGMGPGFEVLREHKNSDDKYGYYDLVVCRKL